MISMLIMAGVVITALAAGLLLSISMGAEPASIPTDDSDERD